MLETPLDALRMVVDETILTDPADLHDHAVSGALIGLQAEIDRLEGQRARLAHAAHVRGLGASDGSPSTAAWLTRRNGMREGDARATITEGAGCALLPSQTASRSRPPTTAAP